MKEIDVEIKVYREDEKASIPEVAYDGTSSAFDLVAIKDTVIPAGGSAVVPNGLRIMIDEKAPFWMNIQLRSSLGFKHSLIPHYGNVDAGYTGVFGVKIFNVGKEDYVVKEGDAYAQVAVIPKPSYKLNEISKEEFEAFSATQRRGDNGFGSSNKK